MFVKNILLAFYITHNTYNSPQDKLTHKVNILTQKLNYK